MTASELVGNFLTGSGINSKQSSNTPAGFSGALTFPSDISAQMSICFIAKEVTLTNDEKSSADIQKEKQRDSINDKESITLADNLLKNSLSKTSIVLPLPNSLNEDVRHSWAAQEGLAKTAVDAAMKAADDVSIFGQKNIASIGLKAGQQTAANAGLRVPVTDPGFFQKYSGTEVRNFSFSWDFVIQTQEDANSIFEIAKRFKVFSAPSQIISNVALLAPNFWVVHINNERLRNSLMLQPMVISSVNVDYAGAGVMEQYFDGTPKFIKLTLACQEISAITRQSYGYDDPVSKSMKSDERITSILNTTEGAGDTTATPA